MEYFVGCDLGGANLRASIVNVINGTVVCEKSIPTFAGNDHKEIISRMGNLFIQTIQESNVSLQEIGGIGIGVPGIVNCYDSTTVFLPRFFEGWRNIPVGKMIYNITNLPTYIINDAQAAAYGEWQFGAGKNKDSIALLSIGTGIGGGFIMNGKLYNGASGMAPSFGHIIIDHNGPDCVCGSKGCLELYVSASIMSLSGIKAVAQEKETMITSLCHSDLNKITPELIAKAADAGDDVAKTIFDQAGYYLGIAVCNIITMMCPQQIIISGGIANAHNLLLPQIRKIVLEKIPPFISEKVEIVPAKLMNRAGMIGAARWAASEMTSALR